jgi:hypothetical protein
MLVISVGVGLSAKHREMNRPVLLYTEERAIHGPGPDEREMCPWAISKYFGDWVPTQVLKCKSMPMDGQVANQK